MKELTFFLSIFSVSIGISGILLALLIYLKEKNRIILLYIFTVLMWTTSFSCQILDFYFYDLTVFHSMLKKIILIIISHITSSIYLLLFAILIYKLFNEKISKLRLTLFIINSFIISIPALSLLHITRYFYYWRQVLAFYSFQIILQLILLFHLAFHILIKSKKIDNMFIKRTIRFFFIIMIISYLFMLLMFLENLPIMTRNLVFSRIWNTIKKHLWYYSVPYLAIMGSSLFYSIINFTWLFFISKFLHFPKIKIIDEKLDLNIFTNIYSISAREKEIIELLMNGLSYKEIGDKLFISFQTVKTHLKNIYKKVNVKNKMELSRLIKKCSN